MAEAFAQSKKATETPTPDNVPPTALAGINTHNAKVTGNVQKDGKKPKILITWGDDVGISNLST